MKTTPWPQNARWQSENGAPVPEALSIVDDSTSADVALAMVRNGETALYRGDYRNARQLLDAMSRRLLKQRPNVRSKELRDHFFAERQAKAREAELLGRLVVEVDAAGRVSADSGPDVKDAVEAAWGPLQGATVVALRELLGVIGAHEWRRNGIEVPAIGGRISPHYGVFGPIRQEYVDLVARAPALNGKIAFDVGTGTGVLAILLAKKGASRVVATDLDPRAVRNARESIEQHGVQKIVSVEERDLLPEGTADVIVFNPPWLPAKPQTSVDRAIYDEGGATVKRFLAEAKAHLEPDGEVWLVISDLAERIGIRRPALLEELWKKGGLKLLSRTEMSARHPRAKDEEDPLHEARAAEVTSLYRLGV
ncbi:MAG: methyltransferase [Myxococcaceae bacterium]